MKVAINATIMGPAPTGIGVYTINVIKELTKLKLSTDEFVVFTPYKEAFSGLDVKVVEVSEKMLTRYYRKAPILRILWNNTIFPIKTRKENFDMFYSPSHQGTLFSKKQILTILDLLPLHFPNQHRLQYYYFKYILPLLARKSAAIITISKSTKQDICKYYGINEDKVFVNYCGYDKAHFNKKDNAIEHVKNIYNIDGYILMVGPSYPHKNIQTAIQAYEKLNTNIKLVIAGSGRKGYLMYLRNIIKERNLTAKVIFLDYVSYSDLPYLYSAAKLLVFPSLYEGFGLPPLEAMACGCPVVVSNTSSLPEVCGMAACYVDPTRIDDMVNGMNKILTDEEFKYSLIKKGIERVNNFSWHNTAKGILEVMRKL